MNKLKGIAYFQSYAWDDREVIRRNVSSEAFARGFSSLDFFVDERNSSQENFFQILNQASQWRGCTLIVPSLYHLENQICSLDSFLRFIDHLGEYEMNFISLDDKLYSDSHARCFIHCLLPAIDKARMTLKSSRIRLAKMEAKNAGEQVGAIRKRDDAKILELRAQGLTIKQIANLLGISTWPVQEALKLGREAL
jgi:hypothetical protein